MPRLSSVREACDYGGFGKTSAYALIHEGRIKAVKLRRRTFVDLDTVDRYLASLPKL